MPGIMAVAVHPDDETLGCGGTLLRSKAEGIPIHWLIVTDMTEEAGYNQVAIQDREREIAAVAQRYGFDQVLRLGYSTGTLDRAPQADLVRKFSDALGQTGPDTLILPFAHDVHSDHRAAFRAAWSAAKTFRHPGVRRVMMMETLSETDFAPGLPGETFAPNLYVDVSEFFDEKLEIMNLFEGQFGRHPFPRSPESVTALALLRGAATHCVRAEAFMLLREIV